MITTKQLKNLIVNLQKEDEFEKFIDEFYGKPEIIIGDFTLKHFKSEGGDGQGDTMEVLFKVIKNGEEDIFRVNGHYDSYNGTEFYDSVNSLYRVNPVQVMVTEYQAVKEED